VPEAEVAALLAAQLLVGRRHPDINNTGFIAALKAWVSAAPAAVIPENELRSVG
jgi:hypothetical protein